MGGFPTSGSGGGGGDPSLGGDLSGTASNATVEKLDGNALDSDGARTALGLAIGSDIQAYSAELAAVAAGTRLTYYSTDKHVTFADFAGLAAGVKTYDVPWETLPDVALFDYVVVPDDGAAAGFDAMGTHPSVTVSAGPAGMPTALLAATHVDDSSMWSVGVQSSGVSTRQDIGGASLVLRFTSSVDLNTLNTGDIKLRLFVFAS